MMKNQKEIKWLFFDVGSTLVDEEEAYRHRIKDMISGTDISFDEIWNRRIQYGKDGYNGDNKVIELYGLVKTPWHSEDEKPFDDAAVKSVTAAGLSSNAADLEYLADGTFTGTVDLFGSGSIDFGEASGIMDILTAAMNGEEGLSMDPDVLFDALIKIMPDREEEIRTLIPVIIELANQEAEAE